MLFVKDVAASLGLTVSNDAKFVREPELFMADLKARNAAFVARLNALGLEVATKRPTAAGVTRQTAVVQHLLFSD